MTNAIAQNMFALVNREGNWRVLIYKIIDYRYDGTEVKEQDAFITMRTGTKHHRETRKGLEVLFQLKDGGTTWVNLKDTKN